MLTGLIIACEDAGGGTGLLRAELPVAGQTLLEQQARMLADVGGGRVIVVAERLPHSLAVAANRLRRDGIAVEIVRAVDDVVLRVRPEERLLLAADGVVCDPRLAERLVAATAPAIMVLPDIPETRGWELIDATSRWAGLLLADGDLVRRTARMLGDWDLQSTLLRTALQGGAERIDAHGAGLLAQIAGPADAAAAEAAISARAVRAHASLVDRWLFDPLARLLAPRAMAAMIDPAWLRSGAVLAWLVAAALFFGGWTGPGLAAALIAGPLDTLGRHLAATTMRARHGPPWRWWLNGAAAAALLSLGWTISAADWTAFALAAATLGFMAALDRHEHWIGRPRARPLWRADPDMIAWGLLPFALTGAWTAGLAAGAAYAFGSLIAVQRLTQRQG